MLLQRLSLGRNLISSRRQHVLPNIKYLSTVTSQSTTRDQKELITKDEIEYFQKHGCVVIRNVFNDKHLRLIAQGIEENMNNPGPYASENEVTEGRFFDDYCNWQKNQSFKDVAFTSPAGELASKAMKSKTATFYHDHVLVKNPATPKATPWHQDSPYYFIGGRQTISLWIPIDPVSDATLRFISGSHLWGRLVRPVRWNDGDSDFYKETHDLDFQPVPNPDDNPGDNEILEWSLTPGDCVLFDFRTVHGARGNSSSSEQRRALSLRFVGDDARYLERPGKASPPFPGHQMVDGQKLREDWFPVVFGGEDK